MVQQHQAKLTQLDSNETPHIERFNRTLREEALNHFVFFGEAHVYRVVSEYIRFFHGARPHQELCGIPDPCSDLAALSEQGTCHSTSSPRRRRLPTRSMKFDQDP